MKIPIKQVQELLIQQQNIARICFEQAYNKSQFKGFIQKHDENLPNKFHEVLSDAYKIMEYPEDFKVLKRYLEL